MTEITATPQDIPQISSRKPNDSQAAKAIRSDPGARRRRSRR